VDIHDFCWKSWISTLRGEPQQPTVADVSSLVHTSAAVAESQHPPLHLRVHVLLLRRALDGQIAEGRSTAGSPARALRAAQLRRASYRAAVARSFRNALENAHEASAARRRSPRAQVAAESAKACSDEIQRLVAALGRPSARARGVAIAAELISDGLGPLYMHGQAERLRNTLVSAETAL